MRDRRNKKRHGNSRRNNKRIYAELDITTYINDEEYVSKMRNVSGNGIQIVKPPNIEIQTKQDCKILIQDNNTSIKLDASVVWIDFGLIGLCFKKQDQRIQKQLNKLSEKLLLATAPVEDVANLI